LLEAQIDEDKTMALRLEFSVKGCYDYEMETLKMLDQSA
jgi:hypothetical protein